MSWRASLSASGAAAATTAATDAVVMTTTTTPAAVTSVRPVYGPVAGGTRVNITTGPAVNATSVLAVHFGRHTVSPLRSRQFHQFTSWWSGTVVERRSLAGELSLSCARPAADG